MPVWAALLITAAALAVGSFGCTVVSRWQFHYSDVMEWRRTAGVLFALAVVLLLVGAWSAVAW